MSSHPINTARWFCFFSICALLLSSAVRSDTLVYQGEQGPGKGKHIVFLAGDHEYRSEETLPALARILAKHHGFKCTVLFNVDPKSGEIAPGNSNMPGLEALDTADLAVVFLRFQDFPDEQMKHVDAYLQRGGPIVGMRTATHAFKIPGKNTYAKYSYDSPVKEYQLGFGHQVLGQTWVGHYGKNHSQSTRISIIDSRKSHPILSGVKDIWVQAGGYVGKPIDGDVLTMAQPLNGMTADSPADSSKAPMPSEWTRSYRSGSGKTGRVFTTLYGTPEDLLNDGYRRMIVNGCFWAAGLEAQIDPNLEISFIGPFQPSTFRFGGHATGIKPEMYVSFDSPIPASASTNGLPTKAVENNTANSSQSSKTARYIRIELPGQKRILTLAEVEVLSEGKNIATSGRATQSTTHGQGVASKAIDGNKDPDWGKGGQTHTENAGTANPWWELDLGAPKKVEKVLIYNRVGFETRLAGFTIALLDAERKEIVKLTAIDAPQILQIDIQGQGKKTYLAYNGKAGQPVKNDSTNASSQPSLVEKPRVAVPDDYRDPNPFKFQTGDVVAIIGNGLPDRMQHDSWLETLLQSELKGERVRFRNLSASGDQVGSHPRTQGVPPLSEYLQHVKADVIFAFFGYNESYAGAEKADDYRKRLLEFVKRTRGEQPNGKSFPRIVLFSPIAFENLKSPNFPDGKEQNILLEAYSKATEQAAQEAGVAYVDLFHPSLELYQQTKQALTINGVHLTEEGNRQLAEVIASRLLGKTVKATKSLDILRTAVKDKDIHWNNRYRARDANDIWGGRSTLAFTNDQTNAVVLQHEMSMLDIMTANRDQHVWSIAQGKVIPIDDSNVPKPVEVVSNVGGGSKSSSAVKEGLLKYISGEEAIGRMAVAEGFEMNLFADEAKFPALANPVQLQFDTKGRLWAAVWPTYPKWEPLREMNDALIILHDDDNDGKADRLTEFAKVHNPLGFEFWNGGVLVTSPPEILFLKDTDGDDVADIRLVMLQGLDSSDTHHGANNFVYGPDGGVYWQSGVFMLHNHEHPWGSSLQAEASAMYRFDPRRFTIARHANNSPNPHGIAFDYWGYHYATDGTGGRAFQVRPDKGGFTMHELLKKEVRPVTACEVVSSSHFPESMQGDFLICNVIGFLGIKHYHLDRNADTGTVWGEPEGAELVVKTINADGSQTEDKSRGLMMSGDKNFRPSDAIFAPDGSLYISDWHNVIIGHMQHNVRDPNRDHIHGRIYRMTAKGRPLQPHIPIDGQPIEALLDNLKSPIDGIRHRTRVELSERDSQEVISAVQQWMKQFDPTKREDAHHLLEALWLHQQHNVRNTQLLGLLLNSPEPHAQIAAKTVKHFWFDIDRGVQGGIVAEAIAAKREKSGILSDTPELTTIRIGTIPEKMRYDVDKLTVKPGKKVKLTFANYDFMPHNILLVKPGTADEIGLKAIELGAKGFEVGYVPESPNILWSIKLVDYGQQKDIEFTAPTEEGAYPYVCTFPGHHLLMRGTLYVTNNLEEYLAKHPEDQVKITDWKLADLEGDLKRVAEHRSFERGQQLFTKLACAQCHQLNPGEKSERQNVNVGPNMQEVVKKYKGDAKLLLQEILEPSRNIEDKYRTVTFALDDGTIVNGNILREDEKTVTLLTGSNPVIEQQIPTNSIDGRKPSPVSLMPVALLNSLDKEQVLDLLAYILAEGNANAPAFKHHH